MSGPLLALFAVVRGVVFGSLLLLGGSETAAALVEKQLASYPALDLPLHRRLRALVPRVLVVLIVAILVKGALQLLSFRDPGEPITGDLASAVLLGGTWGFAWTAQLVTAIGCLIALTVARRKGLAGLRLTIVGTALVFWFQTGMGHAAGSNWPGPVGRLLDLAHLLGLALWLGTLAALTIVAFPSLRGDDRLSLLASVVRGFSLYARIGVALVIVSGVITALMYAGPLAAVLDSTWGKLLLAKLVCMAGVMALGWYNWRVVTPALDGGHPMSRRRLRLAVQLELALALVMLALTTMLVVSPLPGEQ
jgi:putative copper export protein